VWWAWANRAHQVGVLHHSVPREERARIGTMLALGRLNHEKSNCRPGTTRQQVVKNALEMASPRRVVLEE